MTIQSDSEETDEAAELADAAERSQPDILEHAAGPAPVLITEQEVLFGTAAALPPQPAKRVWWWVPAKRVWGWAPAVARVFAASQPRPTRRHYPSRSASYLESSLIAREGYRL